MSAVIPIVVIILIAMIAKNEDGYTDFGMVILWLAVFAFGYFIFVILLGSFFR